jgi:hypothetical protein
MGWRRVVRSKTVIVLSSMKEQRVVCHWKDNDIFEKSTFFDISNDFSSVGDT